ncbi:Ger(x)C family spore germination C-terminal domain-containing protein [Paenibacillus sp. CAU 1782]
MKLEGLAVFNNDKLAGWFGEEQSKGYNFIKNNIRNSAGHITCPSGELIGIETLRNETKINVEISEGKPVVTINIKNVSIVSDVQCTIDVSSPETINEIKKKAAERIKGIIERTIHHAQRKYQFDVFGFGQLFYLEHPKSWAKMKENWSIYYWPNLEVNCDIKVQIHKIGTTRTSVKDALRF